MVITWNKIFGEFNFWFSESTYYPKKLQLICYMMMADLLESVLVIFASRCKIFFRLAKRPQRQRNIALLSCSKKQKRCSEQELRQTCNVPRPRETNADEVSDAEDDSNFSQTGTNVDLGQRKYIIISECWYNGHTIYRKKHIIARWWLSLVVKLLSASTKLLCVELG